MRFEEQIKQYAYKIGIDLVGITTAEPFDEAYARLDKMRQAGYLSPWAEQDLEKRCNPHLLMEDAVSIIAVGISYLQNDGGGDQFSNHPEREETPTVKDFRGRLARFAHFQDYHQLLRAKMEELVEFIGQANPDVKAQIYVDTGPLIDREVAYRAGLGFIGKNAALIHPEFGSFLALGEILLNIPLIPDQPLEKECGQCRRCMQACPQQVIKAPGEIETTQCLAHYTQEKGLLTPEIRQKLGQRLWGCDTCQDVCPFNRQARPGQGLLFQPHSLGSQPDLEKILNLSNQEYKEQVGDTAMAWRGKRTLQRNALINLGNLGDPRAIPILKPALQDQRPIIRGVAAWALGQIGGQDVKELLLERLQVEKDEQVREEIQQSLLNYDQL